jgi:hypothetical protein
MIRYRALLSSCILLALCASPVHARYDQESAYASASAPAADAHPNDSRGKLESLIAQQQSLQQRNELLYQRTERLVQRREKLTQIQIDEADHQAQILKRFEKILTRWEAQQAQYQRYLDGLTKKGR